MEFFDLGEQPISNMYPRSGCEREVPTYHLQLGLCRGCSMVQQLHPPRPEQMFTPDYPYRASGSGRIRQHFAGVAQWIVRHLDEHDLPRFVVEVGSNDGVLTAELLGRGVAHVGVDPSAEAAREAEAKGARVVPSYFTCEVAARLRRDYGPAGVLFSANTVSHISDLQEVLSAADVLLGARGLLVLEDRWLKPIVETNEFDQLYDEHVYLFAVRSVQAMLRRFGFELCAVQQLGVHGGSLRYCAQRREVARPQASVEELLAQEEAGGLDQLETLRQFAERSRHIGETLGLVVRGLVAAGARVDGYGATSRSATAVSVSRLTSSSVGVIYDSTVGKQGRVTPMSGIPIVAPSLLQERRPDFALLFAWNHAEEIRAKEAWFTESGGRWILYQPEVVVL